MSSGKSESLNPRRSLAVAAVLLSVICVYLYSSVVPVSVSPLRAETPEERGFRHLTTKPYLTPDFDDEVFAQLYTQWDEPSRKAAEAATPAERRALTFARYGLTEFPESPRTTALQYTPAADAGWTMNCLACHTGRVAGRVIFGAPNTHYLLQSLTEDVRSVKLRLGKRLTHMDKGSLLYPLGGSAGTTNAVMFGHILLNYRDPDLTFHADRPPPVLTHHDVDAIPWWHYKHKTKLYVDGFAPKNHRALMQFLLIPRNGPDKFAAWEPEYKDIEAWITSLEAPKYPFAIDEKLVTAGHQVFEKNCATCHGHYKAPQNKTGLAPSPRVAALNQTGLAPSPRVRGEGGGEGLVDSSSGQEEQEEQFTGRHPWQTIATHSTLLSYPEKIIPLEEIGTDPVRLNSMSIGGRERYGTTWFTYFGREPVVADPGGYVAPPLEGVWATAPYFHNGSVPTLADVLKSSERPKAWHRTPDGYDTSRVGLEAERLEAVPAAIARDFRARRLYFDTTLDGKSAAGHTFGDRLSDEERKAVVEYLKTL
jgi:mono/diheme cytochrome c family protein